MANPIHCLVAEKLKENEKEPLCFRALGSPKNWQSHFRSANIFHLDLDFGT